MPTVLPTTIHQTEAPDKLVYVVASLEADGIRAPTVVESADSVEAGPGSRLAFDISVVLTSSRLVPPSMGKS